MTIPAVDLGVDGTPPGTEARWWPHLLALGAVLIGLWLLVDPQVSYYSDEGAAATQATLLEQGRGWVFEPAFGDIDPDGVARPFFYGMTVDDGVAPYTKHPLYPMVLAAAHAALGASGFVLSSIIGTVLAAAGAARLASRWGREEALACLWITGLGSPLLFDSFLIVAHTLAAAAVVWAVVGLVAAADRSRSTSQRALSIALASASISISIALRSEAGLYWLAAVTVMAIVALRDRVDRGRLVTFSVVVAASVATARLVEAGVVESIVGSAVPVAQSSSVTVTQRLDAAWTTLVAPNRDGGGPGDLVLLLVGVVLVPAAVHLWRDGRPRLARWSSGAAIVGVVLGALTRSPGAVPGVFVAMPLASAAVVLVSGRRSDRPCLVSMLAASLALFCVAVLATQYGQGGGVEWGWRYVALAVPLAVVVAVHELRHLAVGAPDLARPVLTSVLVVTLVMSVAAVAEVRRGHATTAEVAAAVHRTATALGPDGGRDGRTVVMGVGRLLPDILWPTLDDHAWLSPARGDVALLGARLAEEGVSSMVLVSPDPWRDVEALDGWTAPMGFGERLGVVWVVPVVRVG